MDDAPGATGEGEFPAHPLIAKLLEAGEGVVELRGFIGPTREGDDAVPLYTSLELTERILVPREAIVHVEEPERELRNEEPTKVYVKGSTELRLISCSVRTIRADEATATLWKSKFKPRPIWKVAMSPSGSMTTACSGWLEDCLQRAGSDFQEQIKCISDYVECMEMARGKKPA